MKIASRVEVEDDTVHIQEVHSADPMLDRNRLLRDAEVGLTGEHRLVGSVDLKLLENWAKEAGVKWSDTEAMNEILRKKLLNGEFSKLRVWQGTF